MADVVTTRLEANGPRNAVVRTTLISDGTGTQNLKIWDAQNVANANVVGGQALLPGLHTNLNRLDFDVQDMKFRLDWEATVNEPIGVFGSSPESFDWSTIGGIRVPAGLAGATGSILLSTIGAAVNSTLTVILFLRKNV